MMASIKQMSNAFVQGSPARSVRKQSQQVRSARVRTDNALVHPHVHVSFSKKQPYLQVRTGADELRLHGRQPVDKQPRARFYGALLAVGY